MKPHIHTHKNHNKNIKYRNHEKFGLLVKVLKLFLRHPILVLSYKWEL
jgi:hypothetical protein